MAKKETVMIFGSHLDDFVIGAGGTAARYAKEGKKVISVIFSCGEKSMPWMKEKIAKKRCAGETKEASKFLRCKVVFLGLEEFNFLKDYREKKIGQKLIKLIKKEKPTRFFTHSMDDPHPDHQNVNKIVMEIWEKLNKPKPEVYVFSIWNPVSVRTQYPALYEDITSTFSLKRKALKAFRSQKVHTLYPSLLMCYRAFKDGFKIKKKFAEKFYKVR